MISAPEADPAMAMLSKNQMPGMSPSFTRFESGCQPKLMTCFTFL